MSSITEFVCNDCQEVTKVDWSKLKEDNLFDDDSNIRIVQDGNNYKYVGVCENCGHLEDIEPPVPQLEVTNVDVDKNGMSIAVQDKITNRSCWIDVWKDSSGEWTYDFNQYIFHLDDDADILAKMFQEDIDPEDLFDCVMGAVDEHESVYDSLQESKSKTVGDRLNELKSNKFVGKFADLPENKRPMSYEDWVGSEDYISTLLDAYGVDEEWELADCNISENDVVRLYNDVYLSNFETDGGEDEILEEDCTQASSVDAGKVDLVGTKDKKVEDKGNIDSFEYEGYTFIPYGNVKSNRNLFNLSAKSPDIDEVFNTDDGTYNYNDFYAIAPSYDLFMIKELDNAIVLPSSNYMFEFTGSTDDVILASDVVGDEELSAPDEAGYVGTSEDKEIVSDILGNMTYTDIASKIGYGLNNFQLYNLVTLYLATDDKAVKEKIYDLLEDINYHTESAELVNNPEKLKASLLGNDVVQESLEEGKEDTNKGYSKEDISNLLNNGNILKVGQTQFKLDENNDVNVYDPVATPGWIKHPNMNADDVIEHLYNLQNEGRTITLVSEEPKEPKSTEEMYNLTKETKVKDWYTKTFPDDELGEDINPDITFYDVFEALDNHQDIYEVLGVGDSVIRERVFYELDDMLDEKQGYCYDQWLRESKEVKTEDIDNTVIKEVKSLLDKEGIFANDVFYSDGLLQVTIEGLEGTHKHLDDILKGVGFNLVEVEEISNEDDTYKANRFYTRGDKEVKTEDTADTAIKRNAFDTDTNFTDGPVLLNEDGELVKSYSDDDNEYYVEIHKIAGGRYMNYYYTEDRDHWDSNAGPFDTQEEAEKMALKHRPTVKEIKESVNDENEIPVVNPEEKDYYNGHGYIVGLYPGYGAELVLFKVYSSTDEMGALEQVVAYAEQNGYKGLLLDIQETNADAEKDLAYDKARAILSPEQLKDMEYADIVNLGMKEVEKLKEDNLEEFYDEVDRYLTDVIYVDSTEFGGDCHYVFGDQIQMREFDESKVEESKEVKTEDNSNDYRGVKDRPDIIEHLEKLKLDLMNLKYVTKVEFDTDGYLDDIEGPITLVHYDGLWDSDLSSMQKLEAEDNLKEEVLKVMKDNGVNVELEEFETNDTYFYIVSYSTNWSDGKKTEGRLNETGFCHKGFKLKKVESTSDGRKISDMEDYEVCMAIEGETISIDDVADWNKIMSVVDSLKSSQGFYYRLYKQMVDFEEQYGGAENLPYPITM